MKKEMDNIKMFLTDRIYLLLFTILQMSLISGIVYLDRKSRILEANLVYLLVVSGFFFSGLSLG